MALGLVGLGILFGLLIGALWRGGQARLARRLLGESEAQRQAETEALLDGVKLAFGDISLDTFRRLSEQMLSQAQSALGAERRLQGQQLSAERAESETRLRTMLGQLERMQALIRDIERDREQKFGRLESELRIAGERAQSLAATTQQLADALSNTRARGQWGERMAEDVLRLAGMQEKVSYLRQAATPSGTRPDFTLLLPDGLVVHMDVKFPFDNYLRSLQAPDADARQRLEGAFLKDVRTRIGEVASRDYVAPDAGTIDMALLFIPNEQVFGAMLSLAPLLVDEALGKRVVLVSPLSLFAVLAVIRQATASFRMSRSARELAAGLEAFRNGWRAYQVESLRVGQRLEEAQKAFQLLTVMRRERLEREIDRLDALTRSVQARGDDPS
jgi:DNA recombination protein RmuC